MANRRKKDIVKESDPIKEMPAALTFEAVVGAKGDGEYLTKQVKAEGEPIVDHRGNRYVLTRGSSFRLYRIFKHPSDEDAVHNGKKVAIADELSSPVLWKAMYRNKQKQIVYCFHCLLY